MTPSKDSRDPSVRVRFAPSPTGHLHIGGARTALYNFLFARHHGGSFILRIEDTDKERSTDESTRGILEGMKWLGLTWDEGPVLQSASVEAHRQAVSRLMAEGKAYRCYCSPEELEAMRNAAMAAGKKPRYDGRCRQLTAPPSGKSVDSSVIRFKGPEEGEVAFRDLIKGDVSYQCSELDDLVLLRSDGSPTYNLTVVVDDIAMKITHVIRGDDHLNNTPRQILLYQALGASLPQFAHLSMILGPDRKKLSKRDGVPNVLIYRDQGFLPQAIRNYLVRLGWSHGDQEIFSYEELIALFTLDSVGASPAALNPEKLLWLNSHTIQHMNPAELWNEIVPVLTARGLAAQAVSLERGARIASLLRERAKTLLELADGAAPFLVQEVTFDPEACSKFLTAEAKPLFLDIEKALSEAGTWNEASLKQTLDDLATKHQVKFVKIAQPLRVAMTGTSVSPGIFDVLVVLGRDTVLRRLEIARKKLPA